MKPHTVTPTIVERLNRYATEAAGYRGRALVLMDSAERALSRIQEIRAQLQVARPQLAHHERLVTAGHGQVAPTRDEWKRQVAELELQLAAHEKVRETARDEIARLTARASPINALVDGVLRELGVQREDLGICFTEPVTKPASERILY